MDADVANEMLLKLLSQVDRGGRKTLPVNERSTKRYFQCSDLSSRDSIHAALKNAQQAGGVSLEWGLGSATQDLIRLRITDADILADWLGVARASNHTEDMEQVLKPLISESPDWLVDAYEKARKKWCLGERGLGVANSEPKEAGILFRIALAISRNEQANLDLRRFSVNLLGDSKAIEKRLNRLANLLRENPDWSRIEDNAQLFRSLGLEKFPPPLFLKGPLKIICQRTNVDISDQYPFMGLSPDVITGFVSTRSIPYLLTIENMASFQRYVREVNDDGVVIYTAGFPAPALIKILSIFDSTLPDNCRFFHWGDQDLGGLRIFSKVEEACPNRMLSPHFMTETGRGTKPLSLAQKQAVLCYVAENSSAGRLAKQWSENEYFEMLEQESQDPMPPVWVE